jgi:glucosyl-3-phosphoglycerate synthase
MKISVIIPTLNEGRTIAKVVRTVLLCPEVDEVLVIDDRSVDETAREAAHAGAKVYTSTKIGKGASMLDGLMLARNEILLYLDGDVDEYAPNVVSLMTGPIIAGEADFVKASFQREAGRVTELVAKPLLSLLFPEALKYSQPLSGMIAGKKEFLKRVTFENDYGVDIGILLDVINASARIKEVNIGSLTHKSKPWHQLGRMSREVSRAILKRARHPGLTLDALQTIDIIRDQMEYAIKETLASMKKMAIFDMDNTILLDRFVFRIADELGFRERLLQIVSENDEPFVITKLIAQNLKGISIAQVLSVADGIDMVPDTVDVVKELKNRGYIVGIISDSYDVVAQHVKNKIGADFALANELQFSNSVATGEVSIPSFFLRTGKSLCAHATCKSNAMLTVAEKYAIPLSNIIAIGDSDPDLCLIRFAGIGVAFCSPSELLKSVADYQLDEKKFARILQFAG